MQPTARQPAPTRVLAFPASIELPRPFRNSAATMSDYDEELEETLQNVSRPPCCCWRG
jgi:hypothetical protein